MAEIKPRINLNRVKIDNDRSISSGMFVDSRILYKLPESTELTLHLLAYGFRVRIHYYEDALDMVDYIGKEIRIGSTVLANINRATYATKFRVESFGKDYQIHVTDIGPDVRNKCIIFPWQCIVVD